MSGAYIRFCILSSVISLQVTTMWRKQSLLHSYAGELVRRGKSSAWLSPHAEGRKLHQKNDCEDYYSERTKVKGGTDLI